MSTETWTPMLVVIPKRIADLLTETVQEQVRRMDDAERIHLESFCSEAGWPVDALATGGWLAFVIRKHLGLGEPE